MGRGILAFMLVLLPFGAVAEIAVASKRYVDTQVAEVIDSVEQQVEEKASTKVDTSADANQTMAGTYTVSGTLMVPTPPLPSAD